MDHRAAPPRPEPERSLTWPPALHAAPDQASKIQKGETLPLSAVQYDDDRYAFFKEDLDNNPEYHFLSPIQMYEYEDWAEDSDEDGEEVEWDAGITDFALFDDDRREAQENNRPLPSKWSGMLAQQTSALERAVARSRSDSDPYPLGGPQANGDDDMPSLTPDVSPDLRDDLDVESYHGQTVSRPSVPNYLTITVSPPEEDQEAVSDDELPLSHYITRRQHQEKPNRRLERPGLRHSRTMSGRAHTWTRPKMITVGEDAEGEERAEQSFEDGEDEETRGRR